MMYMYLQGTNNLQTVEKRNIKSIPSGVAFNQIERIPTKKKKKERHLNGPSYALLFLSIGISMIQLNTQKGVYIIPTDRTDTCLLSQFICTLVAHTHVPARKGSGISSIHETNNTEMLF